VKERAKGSVSVSQNANDILLFTYCIHLETVPLFHSMSSYSENKLFIFKNLMLYIMELKIFYLMLSINNLLIFDKPYKPYNIDHQNNILT